MFPGYNAWPWVSLSRSYLDSWYARALGKSLFLRHIPIERLYYLAVGPRDLADNRPGAGPGGG